MKLYDITAAVHAGMLVYPGDPEVSVERLGSGSDSGVRVSRLCLGTHTGTHIDPPLHFIEGGAAVDDIPLELLIGPAQVVWSGSDVIGREFLESADIKADRLLFKTKNSGLMAGPFEKEYACLDEGAAGWLVENGVRLVGMDYLSVERFDADAVHRLLLGNGVVILEGLDLTGVDPGIYELICLPLRIRGGDGAPARVVLREREIKGAGWGQ